MKTVVVSNKLQTVPCGKCLACLSKARQDWAFRLRQEHRYSKGALFITLTYHPKFCPRQLEKEHVQLFMKRLRKHEKGNKVRYFLVGEYGSRRRRPHYHILLFNCDLSGETVRKAWRAPKSKESYGIVHIGRVNSKSIAYCLKYIVQPHLKPKGLTPPFRLMSRSYGIGGMYLSQEMIDWHRQLDANWVTEDKIKMRMPRYYKDKIWYRKVIKSADLTEERIIEHPRRASLMDQAKWDGIKRKRREQRWFSQTFGKDKGRLKMAEMRNAVIQRIKVKVAYSQIL